MKNRLYFHVYSIKLEVNELIKEIVQRIEKSSLNKNVETMNLCVSGDDKHIDKTLVKNFIVHRNKNNCEFDTLNLLREEAKECEFNICYIHTKGITHMKNPCVQDWRRYMSYFILDKWKNRIKDLEEWDCCGVNLQGNWENFKNPFSILGFGEPPLHYSGNFWWSRSSHVKKLNSPLNLMPTKETTKWRMICERWLCQPKDSKYHCVWNSNVNHYQERYTQDKYLQE